MASWTISQCLKLVSPFRWTRSHTLAILQSRFAGAKEPPVSKRPPNHTARLTPIEAGWGLGLASCALSVEDMCR
jgi:hypothetical protein